jgi:hypothetical protein
MVSHFSELAEATRHLIGNQVTASSREFAVHVGVAGIENSPDSNSAPRFVIRFHPQLRGSSHKSMISGGRRGQAGVGVVADRAATHDPSEHTYNAFNSESEEDEYEIDEGQEALPLDLDDHIQVQGDPVRLQELSVLPPLTEPAEPRE